MLRVWTRWISLMQHRAIAAKLRRAPTKEVELLRRAWKIRKWSKTKGNERNKNARVL